MPQIKQNYRQLYGKDMVADTKGDVSGEYQNVFFSLISK